MLCVVTNLRSLKTMKENWNWNGWLGEGGGRIDGRQGKRKKSEESKKMREKICLFLSMDGISFWDQKLGISAPFTRKEKSFKPVDYASFIHCILEIWVKEKKEDFEFVFEMKINFW